MTHALVDFKEEKKGQPLSNNELMSISYIEANSFSYL